MQHIYTYIQAHFSHGSFGGFNRKSIAYQAVNPGTEPLCAYMHVYTSVVNRFEINYKHVVMAD